MDVNLGSTASIVTQPEQTISLSTLTVERMVDLPNEKKVFVFIKELGNQVTLWEGASYDAIGEWTNADVQARLVELYG
jgi:hypothetical protein